MKLSKTGRRPKICMLSSIPATLWSFYRGLPERLKDEGIAVEVCSSPGKELDYFSGQFGINVHRVDILRQIAPWRDVLALLKLVRIFKQNHYELVHSHSPKAGLLGMIAGRLASVRRLVYTCHGLPLETERGLKRKLLLWAERVSCALADQVLVVSPSLLDVLRKYKVGSDKKMSILADGTACGVDLSRFTPTPELLEKGKIIRRGHSIPADDTVIGFVGRLVPDKGIAILVESFVRLYESNRDIRLLVIGDFEPHRGRLPRGTSETLTDHPGIIAVGFTQEVEPYYAAMDMLVLPTRREGFPYSLLEAAAMGLPVITTKVTGCVDAVVDGQTGLLVPPEDVSALTDAIRKLVVSPQLRFRLGRQARKRVEERFSSRRLLDAHVQFYRRMLDL